MKIENVTVLVENE